MDENTVTAVQEGVVDPQTENTDVSTEKVDGSSEEIISQSNEKPVQEKPENDAWKEMRLAREQAEKEAAELKKDIEYIKKYKEYGITSRDDLSQYGYTTWEELDMAVEAQQKNIDPDLYKEIKETREEARKANEELTKYKRKENLDKEIQALLKDEKRGNIYKKFEADIRQTAEQYNVDAKVASMLVLDQKLEDLTPNIEEIKQNAIKEYIEGLKGQKPVLGSGNTPAIINKPTTSWEDARKQTMSILKQAKE